MSPDTMGIRIADHVPRDTVEAQEIGFSVPEHYNASQILFDNLSRGNGEKVALYCASGPVTYAALCAEAGRAANAIKSRGLLPGERIILMLDDTPMYPALFFGALRAGVVPILLNTASPKELIRYFIEDSAALAVFCEADYAPLFDEECLIGTDVKTIVTVNGKTSTSMAAEIIAGNSWIKGFDEQFEPVETHRDDMAFWMYSSGTTGQPKGVVHLHHDLLYTAESYSRHILELKPDDICFSVPKIYFAYGLGNALTFPFHAGCSSVLFSGRPTAASVFGQIERFRPTVFFGLPTLYNALLHDEHSGGADLSSIRLCISAAETLSKEMADGWKQRFGHEIVEGLGSTEMLHIYISNSPTALRHGAAGRRVPGYSLELRDWQGRRVENGKEGVLWVRGDSAAPCYWNKPEKTKAAVADGWLCSGDIFTRDKDGFHYFRGRADDLVKISGQWVYPIEVEQCLAQHPKIRECAVAAIKLEDGRATLRAWIVPQDAAPGDELTEDIQQYVKARLLPHKYPRQIEYRKDLPKTGTGKIDRQVLISG